MNTTRSATPDFGQFFKKGGKRGGCRKFDEIESLMYSFADEINRDPLNINELDSLIFRMVKEIEYYHKIRNESFSPSGECDWASGLPAWEAARWILDFCDYSNRAFHDEFLIFDGLRKTRECKTRQNFVGFIDKINGMVKSVFLKKMFSEQIAEIFKNKYETHPLLKPIVKWLANDNQWGGPQHKKAVKNFLTSLIFCLGPDNWRGEWEPAKDPVFLDSLARALVRGQFASAESYVVTGGLYEVVPYAAKEVWKHNFEKVKDNIMVPLHGKGLADIMLVIPPTRASECSRYFAVLWDLWPAWVKFAEERSK